VRLNPSIAAILVVHGELQHSHSLVFAEAFVEEHSDAICDALDILMRRRIDALSRTAPQSLRSDRHEA
jgi:hypothetical protein